MIQALFLSSQILYRRGTALHTYWPDVLTQSSALFWLYISEPLNWHTSLAATEQLDLKELASVFRAKHK